MQVLKTAAIVIGAAALVATGVGLAAGLGVTAGIGIAGATVASVTGSALLGTVAAGALVAGAVFTLAEVAGAILPKPSSGGSQTKWKGDPYAGIPYVMGRTLVGGNIVLRRGSGGSNTYEHFVTVLSLGPIQSIDQTFANKSTIGFGGDNLNGGANGTYSGQIWQSTQRGACPEPAALSPLAGACPDWTWQHKLSGLAATFVTFKYDSKTTNGLTSEPAMSWIGHFVKVYDPRLDSTYPGGAGPCRAFDEATYVWSENPHLHGLTWALGRYQNGRRVAGIGTGTKVPAGTIRGVDIASFVEGANLDDARGWKIGGQVVTRPDTLWNSLKSMLQAGGAQPALIGGVITAINRAPRVSLATITRRDIVGKCTFSGTQARRSRINGVIPQYRSEQHDWQMVSASAVSIADYVALDGDERTKEIAYLLVQDVHQAAQLATYDICDAREAGPGSIPLGPWWLNYRPGDCVTFEPEDDLSIKVALTGRALEAQTGVVTYTVRGETDGKHALALGQTGQAPPIVSLAYSPEVDAPDAGDWAATGVALSASGGAIPALHITGAVGDASAQEVIFEYRLHGSTVWMAAGSDAPSTTDKVIASVAPGASYDVAVSYRVRGVLGDRLVLGPVTAGSLSPARAAYQIVRQTVDYPVSDTSTAIAIAAFDAVLDDGAMLSFPAGSVATTAATSYVVLWDLQTSAYLAVPAPALDQVASARYVIIRNYTTGNGDGSYPEQPTAPGGDGGGGYGGTGCPVPDALVLLANDARDGPGDVVVAGALRPGVDWVWSPHEHTGEWAAWPVIAARRIESDVWQSAGRPDTSPSHLWSIGGEWVRMDAIGAPAGRAGTVMAITIGEAHTYVLIGDGGEWLVSHNKAAEPTT